MWRGTIPLVCVAVSALNTAVVHAQAASRLAEMQKAGPACGNRVFTSMGDEASAITILQRLNGVKELPKWAGWTDKLESAADSKAVAGSVVGYFLGKMGVLFDTKGTLRKAMADRVLPRFDTVPAKELTRWQDAFQAISSDEAFRARLSEGGGIVYGVRLDEPERIVRAEFGLSLTLPDEFYSSGRYDVTRAAKYIERMKQLNANDIRAWIDWAPSFRHAEVDAALGLVLVEELFNAGVFNREAFTAALGKPREEPPVRAETESTNEETIAELEKLGATVAKGGEQASLVVDEVTVEQMRKLGALEGLKRLRLAFVSDETMAHVGALSSVRALTISGKMDTVTDKGVRHLEKLQGLDELHLAWTKVTATGVEHIARLKTLRRLDFSPPWKSKFTEAGLSDLKKMGAVERVFMGSDGIDDKALKSLRTLASLHEFDLCCTKVTAAGLKELAALKNLRRLNLSHCRIGDLGLEPLKRLSNLEWLILYGTDITDKGISHLKEMKKLKRLSVASWELSEEACAELQKALPECKIDRLIPG